MLTIINVAFGAMLGIVLADSPAFKVNELDDLVVTLFFLLLITAQAVNVWAASRAASARNLGYSGGAVFLYFAMQVVVFTHFCMAWGVVSDGTEGILLVFTGKIYAWTFLLVSSVWFIANVVASWITRESIV